MLLYQRFKIQHSHAKPQVNLEGNAQCSQNSTGDPDSAEDEKKPMAHEGSVLLSFTWSFMEPRHIVIERSSLKRLYVYSNRDTGRKRRQESEREG